MSHPLERPCGVRISTPGISTVVSLALVATSIGGPGSARPPESGGTAVGRICPSAGTALDEAKISATDGMFTGGVDPGDFFGIGVGSVGDLNGDGIPELAVGAVGDDDGGPDRGAVWILFMNAHGSVDSHQKISSTTGGFQGPINDGDYFGRRVAGIGDVDGDGVPDLAVGASYHHDGGPSRGAVWILFMPPQANL